MSFCIKLPEEMTPIQKETYNKNCELYKLALKNKNRCGVLISMCADLGIQDTIWWDVEQLINVYPYSSIWYVLAYGYEYKDET